MTLSDVDIKKEIESGRIICEPLLEENISNSSVDLRLGRYIKKYKLNSARITTVSFDVDEVTGKVKVKYPEGNTLETIDLQQEGRYVIKPNEFILAETFEYVGQNGDFKSQIHDKSSLARLGLSVCFNAGYIDAGNALNITLEIKNHNLMPIELFYKQHICQITFTELKTPTSKPYSGKYKNSKITEGGK